MNLFDITPLILTFNESPNIGRALDRLTWSRDIVVVDSCSSDDTLQIVGRYSNTRAVQRRFDSHAQQWNFGLAETSIATEWVLALDADYILTEDFLQELRNLDPEADVAGYWVQFRYCIAGRPLRGAVYTPVIVLYRRSCAEYVQDGHTQRVRIAGRVLNLKNPILHDDRKSLSGWITAQDRYMRLEAEKLLAADWSALAWSGRIRKLRLVAPFAMLCYCLFVRGLILDGRAGLFYSFQRALAELLLSLRLLQHDLSDRSDVPSGDRDS